MGFRTSRVSILSVVDGILNAIGRVLGLLKRPRFEPTSVLDLEKTPPLHEAHADILAHLKHREALEDEFAAKVMELLVPLQRTLEEMSDEALPPYPSEPALPGIPPLPQIFFGRDEETVALARHLTNGSEASCVAIVGPEGAGKSALALALLHRPELVGHYGVRRFYLRCPREGTVDHVVQSLATIVGLAQSNDAETFHRVVASLSSSPFASVLVLDGLDQLDPSDLVPLLEALSAIPRLSLVLTTRSPHSLPHSLAAQTSILHLAALSLAASRALFYAVADFPADPSTPSADVDSLLRHTQYLPNAVIELAQRAQYVPLAFLAAECLEAGDLGEAFADP
ncbi:AAA domain-containing protein [Mycena chlorophos]|uniref:AAA domain-containing protein n=1 Tax=Mycena chlorophos TaxID=658473 RepID=A0A8H6WHE5_MYCCL|nr:AAA domain-containing protein [Mycena chlorophos]